MQYLLDTHTLLWFLEGNEQLPDHLREEIENTNNACFISIASLWEISIKLTLGKLTLQFPFSKLSSYLEENTIELLPINFIHPEQLGQLDLHHRDPFDRIIIAQGITENLTVLTRDEHFNPYPVNQFWK